jgi:hypothetical protein
MALSAGAVLAWQYSERAGTADRTLSGPGRTSSSEVTPPDRSCRRHRGPSSRPVTFQTARRRQQMWESDRHDPGVLGPQPASGETDRGRPIPSVQEVCGPRWAGVTFVQPTEARTLGEVDGRLVGVVGGSVRAVRVGVLRGDALTGGGAPFVDGVADRHPRASGAGGGPQARPQRLAV